MDNYHQWINYILLQALLQKFPRGSTRLVRIPRHSRVRAPNIIQISTIYSDVEELKILSHLVRPSMLAVEVRHGREKPPTSYEFYCPSIVARQIGFGQLPLALFFADKLKLRETVTNSIEFNRILQFEQALLPEAISGWEGVPFTSSTFDHWWQE